MSTPLVDIDANARHAGFRTTKEGSKIPSPPKIQRSGSSDRRRPFSVSTTGSPCYTAMPTGSKAVVSPTPMSKLPRKSTPTQSTFSKSYTYGSRPTTPLSSVPRSRGGLKQSAIAIAPLPNTVRTTPPLRCNKPLPSPPIAQLLNPQSPPKAQRTLIDAEAGTPTEEQWPILRPENVSPSKAPVLPEPDRLPQRSVSEGSALQRNGIPLPESRMKTPRFENNRTPSQKCPSSFANDEQSHKKFNQMTEPRTFSPMNPYAKSFHAFSTNTEVAIDSPLAHNRRTPPVLSIPPRSSSKRSSLPLPNKAQHETLMQPTADITRVSKAGSTVWPVLGTAADQIIIEQSTTEELSDHGQKSLTEATQDRLATRSHYGSIDSVSTWSLAAGSSLNDEPEVHHEGTVRVKRLSWHSSHPDSGPILRIFADADAVLLGQDDVIPAVPALPDFIPGKVPQERSLSTLAGRVSKQVLAKMNSSTSSRSPTPSSVGPEGTESKPVKITPIRSMQPPRQPSIGDLSEKSKLAIVPAPAEAGQEKQPAEMSRDDTCGSLEAAQGTLMSQAKSDSEHQAPDETQKHSYETGNYSTTLQNVLPKKATQVLGTDGCTTPTATPKRLPATWMTTKTSTSSTKKTNATRCKTSPSLLSVEQFNHRASTPSTRSPSSASSNLARSIPSQVASRRPGPSRLGVTVESLQASDCSEDAQAYEQDGASTARMIKAKRSFRNIFLRRTPKCTPQPAKKHDSKHSSVAGNTLAQRIRNSTNFSKVSLAKPFAIKQEIEQGSVLRPTDNGTIEQEISRQAALSVLESGLPNMAPLPASVTQYDTATVVNNIVDRVTTMGEDSPDRLRGLEIAEAILHAFECFQEAKLSAELARKHANDAELHAERAGVELTRLEKLCEPCFDDAAMQAIRQLITTDGVVELSETNQKESIMRHPES